MAQWQPAGLHRYQLTDDLLHWLPGGEVLPEHAELVGSLLAKICSRYGYALWLIDAERSVPLGHASRVVYARWFAQEPRQVAVAAFNAQRPAQTTSELTARGVRLLTSRELFNQTFANESEARSYLDQKRRIMQSTAR